MAFSELCITSNFTFLTGGSHPQEYAQLACKMNMPAFAIADINSVAGIVRAHQELREIKREKEFTSRLLPAATLETMDGFRVTALPCNRQGWANLCRILTLGRRRAAKGDCELYIKDIIEWGGDQILLIHPTYGFEKPAKQLISTFGNSCYLVLSPRYDGDDQIHFKQLNIAAQKLGISTIASATPIMHRAQKRRVVDIMTCIREGLKIDQIGKNALTNAENRMRSDIEMRNIFNGFEASIHLTSAVVERCKFSLDQLRYEYPKEIRKGEEPDERLRRLSHEGLRWRYPEGASERVKKQLLHELKLIEKLGYAPYFLTVHDVVEFARSREILCQGRGSAANSIVCYALGVTSVSPEIGTMVFERFVSEARNEPPDIDVDFEHERREEVIQYIYQRYGRHRAGLCATVIHFRSKRTIREVGQAMGLSNDTITTLSAQMWGWGAAKGEERDKLREIGLNPDDLRLKQTLNLCEQIIGFPRHMSQHVGGFIMTEGRLDELVPIENAAMDDRTVICWDKDDIDTLGILKVDILSLGMLTCIRKSFDLLLKHLGVDFTLATLPTEDPAVYDMLCNADSIGVFQVESRAQMNFLPRMRPRNFYDLVIEVAIIRPGPIQGDMVHPYIRRRRGEEPVSFPSDELGAVLGKTLGVPLFQEQAMQIAIIGAGFTPDEADRLRRSLATFKKTGSIHVFQERFITGMLNNGYELDFAQRCFSQIEGFGSYGFPESHAARANRTRCTGTWRHCTACLYQQQLLGQRHGA